MRQIDRDNLPHMVKCLRRIAVTGWRTCWARLAAHGWGVSLGPGCAFNRTDWHMDDPRTGPDAPVTIEKGVWLGFNVTVLKGVTIGENTFVAAGSLVTHSLPANVVAGGIPAKVLKEIDAHQLRVKQ